MYTQLYFLLKVLVLGRPPIFAYLGTPSMMLLHLLLSRSTGTDSNQHRYSQKWPLGVILFLEKAGTKFRTSRILYSRCHEPRYLVNHRRIQVVQQYGAHSKLSKTKKKCKIVSVYTVSVQFYSVCVQFTLCAYKFIENLSCMHDSNNRARAAAAARARIQNRLLVHVHEIDVLEYAFHGSTNHACTIIVDQNSVVAISGMRDSGACSPM